MDDTYKSEQITRKLAKEKINLLLHNCPMRVTQGYEKQFIT